MFRIQNPLFRSRLVFLWFFINLSFITCSTATAEVTQQKTDSRYPSLDILAAPQSLTVTVGETAVFDVDAVTNSTRDIRYRWFHNGTRISGETSNALVIENVQLSDAGRYKVKVRARKTREKLFAELVVVEPESTTEINLTSISAAQDVLLGDAVSFYVDAGTNDGTPLSYAWFHNGSLLDGETDNMLSFTPNSLDDAGEYRVVISAGDATKEALTQLTLSEPVTPTELFIVSAPSSMQIQEGESVSMTVVAETNDGSDISYLWFFQGDPLPDYRTDTLSIPSASLYDAGDYQVVVSVGELSKTLASSLVVTQTVVPTEVIVLSEPKSSEVLVGESVSFSIDANTNDGMPISYTWFHNGQPIPGAYSSVFTIAEPDITDAGQYQVVMSAGDATANASASLVVSEPVVPTELTVLASPISAEVEEGQSNAFTVLAETNDGSPISYQWLHNGTAINGEKTQSLMIDEVKLSDAGRYQVQMTAGEVTKSVSASLNVNEVVVPTAIEIVSGLDSIAVEEGEYAMFSVVATTNDGSPLSYAWFFNGDKIDGANRDFYSVEQTNIDDAGQYRVVVSAGEVDKAVSAILEVTAPELPPFYPIEISLHPTSLSAFVNESVTLNVSATSEQAMTYQWRKNGQAIDGSSKAYLELSNLQLVDSAQYDVVIMNGTDIVVSQVANIAVSELPDVQLSWSLPSEREDGSDLMSEEISGFSIYKLEEESGHESKLSIDGLMTEHNVGQLQRGRYHFSISTVDVEGMEGARSDAIIVDVN